MDSDFFEKNYKVIYSACKLYPSRVHDYEDWCSICVLHILKKLNLYDENKAKFSSWVYIIIKRLRNFEDGLIKNNLFKTNYNWNILDD